MGKSTKEVTKALGLIDEILDELAYYQVVGDKAPDTTSSIVDRVQSKLSKVYFLLDRIYPEAAYDDDYEGQRELDFGDEAQSGFDYEEEESR